MHEISTALNFVILLIIHARIQFIQPVITNKAKTGSLWKTIGQALPNKSSQRPQYTRDTNVLENEFNRFFISVGQETVKKLVELAYQSSRPTVTFPHHMVRPLYNYLRARKSASFFKQRRPTTCEK